MLVHPISAASQPLHAFELCTTFFDPIIFEAMQDVANLSFVPNEMNKIKCLVWCTKLLLYRDLRKHRITRIYFMPPYKKIYVDICFNHHLLSFAFLNTLFL